ncbi:transcriptional regulator [Thermococci archaeon]|nr:MAG: transcriptional regulator [Thermococci archaeon]
MKTPCEMIVWYLLPAIRGEFARVLVKEFNLTQREAAKKLGVTESAVSQYLNSKRGKEIKFDHEIIEMIEKSAKEILESEEESIIIKKTCFICTMIKDHGILYDLIKEAEK